ncbi:polymer-forming cytoskeletal protein [Komagataeibacter oboediens]|nr:MULTISPECIES: polymer-forming cytoskeletal protein [Komagataeibacter]MCK9819772.1 polymer-forming cytoskeletal protein [Komagataeibacter oboediens]WEQ52745.1 polymer-forming cytoskeletal protein [Komagataeibacter oboediens]
MFRRRKPAETQPPAPTTPPAQQPGRPATGGGSSPSTTPASKENTSMARPPFPPTPNAPPAPGGARPGAPGAAVAKKENDRRTLVVGRGISVQGTIQDAERLVVEGTVESSLINASELQIAQGGVFKGEVEVEDAELAGTIDGTLTVRGSLTIRSTGRLLGKAKCRRLKVEDGGQVTGQLEMITAPAAPAAAPATPPRPAAE